jgi:hypothetical protein
MRPTARLFAIAVTTLLLGGVAAPAGADHTNPRQPLSPIVGGPAPEFITQGIGTWRFIRNFPANPGTDVKFFTKSGEIYASSGTLGQGNEGHVGQRILRLTDDGVVDPQWVADHGSAHCTLGSTGVTGLQHDVAVGLNNGPRILIDATDATGRCHDAPGGGLELVDISRLEDAAYSPREIHLTRHAGTSHTVTVDATRPWIVYNSTSDFAGRPWIDVLDIRTCFGRNRDTLAQKRENCRPEVYRIPFQPDWSRQRDFQTGQLKPGSEAACHDITARPGRLYCAALNATLIFDVSGLTDADGNVLGSPLSCPVANGTNTGAQVTDCSGAGPGSSEATGWQFLGTFNHPGRECGGGQTSCNSNLFVESDQGVSVSHEADPTNDGQWMFVTDERGGGVVPPGSSCTPGIDNPYGNGGAHVFDISDPANIEYALTPSGEKAVYISDAIVPAGTFCDIHVMEPLPREMRFVTAYYSQGTKIVDWEIDSTGHWTFVEVAELVLPGANTWVVQPFKVVRHGDGMVTYYLMASDIQRGIDIFSWTGPEHRRGPSPARQAGGAGAGVDAALAGLAVVLLPLAARFGRRRRARA